jgi:hypothetical protein
MGIRINVGVSFTTLLFPTIEDLQFLTLGKSTLNFLFLLETRTALQYA